MPDHDDLQDYPLRPILIDAARGHSDGSIAYESDGTVRLVSQALAGYGKPTAVRIPPERQYSLIRATLDDLNKAVSSLANSPRLDGEQTLRGLYEAESAHYEELVLRCEAVGGFEPDYGTYVYDHHAGNLYLVAPEFWHRLALVTSTAMLLTDPAGAMTWKEIRRCLECAVVGVIGVSVGGNVLEGWLREARPRAVKIADLDWVEVTNLNRAERLSIRHLAASRAARFDRRDPYDVPRLQKVDCTAYEQHLVDPYLKIFLYREGITRANINRFLMGDGMAEPPLHVVVEELDDLKLKIVIREHARSQGVDVAMLSDFGHSVNVLWNMFGAHPDAPLGAGGTDEQLVDAVAALERGGRSHLALVIERFCGPEYSRDQFMAFLGGHGEQPTASLPQSGATAMASGGIGGKEIALRMLGHRAGVTTNVAYDLLHRELRK
jgi:hypothetical protein